MLCKETEELSNLISEQKKAVFIEAELLNKIYDWFNDIGTKNISAAIEIVPQDVQNISDMNADKAKDIESRTGIAGLSNLVIERKKMIEKIAERDDKLSELWRQSLLTSK